MKTIRLPLLVAISFAVLGCGGSSASRQETRESAKQAFKEAETAFAAKDFSTAEEKYTQALEGGGLHIDLLDGAAAKRAVCRAELGNLDQAMTDLKEWQRNAIQLDIVLAAQSFVLEKQGDTQQAKAAWSKARRINRYVEKFGD